MFESSLDLDCLSVRIVIICTLLKEIALVKKVVTLLFLNWPITKFKQVPTSFCMCVFEYIIQKLHLHFPYMLVMSMSLEFE